MAQQDIIIGAADAKAGDTLFSAFTKTQANFTELYSLAPLDQQQMFYVAKAGNDSNSGLNITEPFLTIGAAITAASLLTPAVDNQITIQVIDTGDYVESPTLPEWVHLDASNAALNGRLTIEDNTITSFRRLQNSTVGQSVARKSNGLGFAKVAVELLIVADAGQDGMKVDAGVVHIDAGVMSIDAGIGIKAKNGSRVSFIVSEVQLLNGGLGIGTRTAGGGANFFSGNILYAKDDGSGVFVEAKVAGDIINIQAGSIIVDTLYDMGANTTLNIFATEATGTVIKNATATVNSTLAGDLANRVRVSKASDLAGTLDSTKQYFIDGIIDMGSQSIEVPQGGLTLTGYSFDLSKLISSEAAYTMFTSPASGSGNVLGMDYAIEVTGAGSQVYDLVSDTGFEAFEFTRVNYNDCSSLGSIDNYRQGLEIGTGRFGGKPELTLVGVWLGGYFIDTSIVRSLVDGAYSLFSAGAGFVMSSRFRSNQNIDLPASASFIDFAASNFVNPSTLQLDGCLITRDGVFDATDTNIIPNIGAEELVCEWMGNNGIDNTFVGGEAIVTVEVETIIVSSGVYVDLAGTFTASDLTHFDSPSNGQLRHLGDSPREYQVGGQLVIDGTSSDVVALRAVIFRSASTTFEDQKTQTRVINALQGGRDVGYYVYFDNITLNKNDYVFFQVANIGATNNVTAELDSSFAVQAR